MYVNSVSTINVNGTPSIQFTSRPIAPEKKATSDEGYEPVTAALWGASASHVQAMPYIPVKSNVSFAVDQNSDVDFGAARPTNNPKSMPAIEADTQSGFKLSSLDMPMICPDCGKPIMTKPIFAAIKSELDASDDKTYLSTVDKHSEFLFPQEQKILKHLKAAQAKNPDLTIRDIVVAEREKRFDALEAQQYAVMDEIEAVAETLPYEDRSKVHGLAFVSSNIIFERSNNYAFQRGKFLELVDDLQLKDGSAKEKVKEIAETLPSSMTSEDAWYVKYGGVDKKKQPYSSRAIAEKLLAPAYTNTDHVHPWNRGGYDAVSNFWLMHARCNIIKTDKPFMEWLNEDRLHRVDYIGQYLRDAQKAIDESGDPKMQEKYGLYSAKLAKTIYYETDGDVDYTEEFPLPEDYDVPRPESNEKKAA